MTDDKTAKDTARDPEREALGRLRGGLRAAAKKAVRKVAKKSGQRRTTKKTTAAATKKTTAASAKTTARAAGSAQRGDKSAPAGGGAPASRAAARTSAAKGRAAPSGTTKAASGTARAADAAPAHEAGPSIESPRPPGPIHPGAALDSVQEHAGGFGSLLALWGPLIIVGFLVLVFRGGDEGESTVTAGADVPGRAATKAQAGVARGPQYGGGVNPAAAGGARTPPAVPPVAAQGAVEAFDGGFAMRTSMASPPVFAGGGSGTGMPAVASRRLYPSPPGPYRDPRYPGVPTGESWSADSAREWMWSAEGRSGPGREDGGDTPVQWVRCAPPYYWCPAPDRPAW